jgi:ABC-type multidrug transport system fused ATPase/permease subunit
MLGASTSVFNEAGSLVKDWLKNPLNAAFVYWYFLPAAGFVLLQLFIVGPAFGYPPPNILRTEVASSKSALDLILQILNASFFALIVLPLVIGVVFSSISGSIHRLYLGALPIVRPLFRPWLKRNQKRSRKLYGDLPTKRRQYFILAANASRPEKLDDKQTADEKANQERADMIAQLKSEIQSIHEKIESISQTQQLPVEIGRVGPNQLSNTLSLAEEYPFERYGMDAAVFWPRVSAEIEPAKLESLSASFAAMNGLLNLSILNLLFAIEAIVIVLLWSRGVIQPAAPPLIRMRWLLVAALATIAVGWATYRAAVRAARSVTNAMRTAFDYYRGAVLSRFNLKLPDDIEEERVVWLKLGAFIRRGESFYYPSEFRR